MTEKDEYEESSETGSGNDEDYKTLEGLFYFKSRLDNHLSKTRKTLGELYYVDYSTLPRFQKERFLGNLTKEREEQLMGLTDDEFEFKFQFLEDLENYRNGTGKFKQGETKKRRIAYIKSANAKTNSSCLTAEDYNIKLEIQQKMDELQHNPLSRGQMTDEQVILARNKYISEAVDLVKRAKDFKKHIEEEKMKCALDPLEYFKEKSGEYTRRKKRSREDDDNKKKEKGAEEEEQEENEGERTDRPSKKPRREEMRCKVCNIKSKFADPHLGVVLCKDSDCQLKLYIKIQSYINQLKFGN
jgi:hypothetical protein